MQFKDWITLQESIVVQDIGSEATLHVVEPNLIKEFNFEQQLMPILKRTIDSSLKAKDPEYQEPLLRMYNKITLDPRDKANRRVIPAEKFMS